MSTSRCGRTGRTSSTTRRGTRGSATSVDTTSAGSCSTHRRCLAFCAPTTNSYRRLVPGFEAPINLVYSQRNRSACVRIPMYLQSEKAKRLEYRPPDPTANPYLAFSALLQAGLDGIRNKIEPPDPIDKDLYELDARGGGNGQAGAGLAGGGPGRPGGGSRVPARGRRLHRGPDRNLARLQAQARNSTRSGNGRTPGSSCSTTTCDGFHRVSLLRSASCRRLPRSSARVGPDVHGRRSGLPIGPGRSRAPSGAGWPGSPAGRARRVAAGSRHDRVGARYTRVSITISTAPVM